jgi:hypothetical protein
MQAQSPPTQAPKAAEPSNRQKKRLARSDGRGASKKNRLVVKVVRVLRVVRIVPGIARADAEIAEVPGD